MTDHTDPTEHEFDDCLDKVISEMFSRPDNAPISVSGPETAPPPWVPPNQIGPYRIFEAVGEGGLGVVLRARDDQFGRDIAIKMLRPEHVDRPDMVQQFLAEARITGSLQHPGIVPIHDMGHTEDGVPYFAMKIVEGETLASQLKGGARSDDETRRLLRAFERVCDTVAFAHAQGLVHRDLKPGNVMVGAFGEVQVLDWGFATSPGDVAETEGTRIAGTPAYMAPEQARGELHKVDARTDVFALGAILTEILTGAPPYVADTRDEIYLRARRAWVEDAYARLSDSGGHETLVTLARTCLAPDPSERPADARAVALKIDAHLVWLERRAQELEVDAAKARARHRLTLVIAAAVGVVLLAVGAWWWMRQEARKDVARALHRAQLLAEQVDDATARPRHWDQAIAAAEQAAIVARPYADLAETSEQLVGELRGKRMRAQRQRAFLDWLSESSCTVVGETQPRSELVAAFRAVGIDLEVLGINAAARIISESPIKEQLLEALDQRVFDLSATEGSPLSGKVLQVALLADSDPWRNAVRRAFESDDIDDLRQLADSAEMQANSSGTALHLLARALRRKGRHDDAIATWRQALSSHPDDYSIVHELEQMLWERGAPPDEILWLSLRGVTLRPDFSHAWNHLADAARLAGLEPLAHSAWDRCVELEPGLSRRRSVEHIRAKQMRARGFPIEALAHYRQLIAKQPDDVGARFAIARLLYRLQDPEAAIAAYEAQIRLTDTPETRCNLGLALSLAGRFKEAVVELQRGHEQGKLRGSWPYDTARWLERIRAFEEFATAIETDPSGDGPRDPQQRAVAGTVAMRMNRPATALRWLRSAFEQRADLGHDCSNTPTPHSPCFRMWAAQAAIQVATRPGTPLSDERVVSLLTAALGHMRAELRALEQRGRESGHRMSIRASLARMMHAPVLAPVRPDEGLEQLPPSEQGAWRVFWSDVEAAYRKDG